MGRLIEINPVTRIEGHARVTIQLADDGTVSDAQLHVLEFRGFERFVQGMHVEMMPTVTTRICGTCPHAHHLAASKAVDAVFGVTPPRTGRLLRELLNAGSIIHSHAIHFFALAGPDLILGLDAAPERRNLVALLQIAPDLAQKALRLRSIGQRIAEEIGGRGTHPVTCVVGGVSSPLTKESHERLVAMVTEAVPLSEAIAEAAFDILGKNDALCRTFELPVHDIATIRDGVADCYDGTLRVRAPDGSIAREFPVSDYQKHMVEQALPYSYAKQILLHNGQGPHLAYRVGALARLNCTDRLDTPRAQAAFERFTAAFGHSCHFTAAQHHARLIEIVHQVEKAAAILADPEILSPNTRTTEVGKPRRGIAHVEAPRGVLIHDYQVDDNANVVAANLLVATQHNIASINRTVTDAARYFVEKAEPELLNGVEFAIRCWDPASPARRTQPGRCRLK